MAQLTKAQLEAQNQSDFPNNNSGLITPQILREYNTDVIDSLVDEVSYNIDSASFSSSIAQLQQFSSSLDATFATDAQLTSLSASIAVTDSAQSASIASLQDFSSSLDATFATDAQLSASVSALSSSIAVTDLAQSASIASLQQFSSSLDSGFVSEAEFGAYTSSNDGKVNSLIDKTGSYATTGSNSFIGNQTITGAVTASTLRVDGLNYPTADNGAESFIQTDGAGTLSLQYVKTMYQNIRNRESVTINKGTPLFASGSTGDNVDVYIADAGNPLRMPATLIAGDTTLAAGATGKGIIFGHIEGVDTNAYPAGTEVYVGVGGGWTATRPTGSSTPIQPLGVVTRQGNNGMGIVMTETPYDLPNLQSGYVWVGNGTDQPVSRSLSDLGLALTGSNNSFSGTQTFNNIVVNGTGSFAYIQSVTGSAKVIGDAFIILNNDTPTERYAGIIVQDSGSNNNTASFEFDGQTNDWFYQYTDDGGATNDYGVALFGPEYNSLGNPSYPTSNRIQKGTGGHHLADSNLSDNGTSIVSTTDIIVTGSVTATGGFIGTATNATTASFAQNADLLDGKNSTEFATTGSNTFTGNQTINANLVANKVSAFNFDSLFLGSQMGGTTANGTFFGYGSNSYEFIVGAYAGGFDNELKITANNTGLLFGDFNGSSYPTWLKLVSNPGTNPAPQFVRGLGITGSLGVTGNTTLGDATSDTTTINGSTTINGNGEATVALQVISGSVEIIGPRGNGGHFYSNLPITSSEGRINGTFIVNDLIVSGAFGGNSSVNVYRDLAVTGSTRLGTDFTNDTHIISGAVSIQGSLTANGKNIINEINNLNTFSSSINSQTSSYARTNTTNTFSANQTINGTLRVNSPTASNESSIEYIKLPTFTAANGTTYDYASIALQDYASSGIDQTFAIEYANASFEKYSALYVGPSRTQFIVGTGTGYDYDVIELLDNNNNTTTAKVKADTVILQGDIQITGSVNANVVSQSYSSNTASFNLDNGNFFNLTLPDALTQSSTQLELTNLKPGQTVNVRMNLANGVGAVTFGSNIKQVSGSIYVPSTTATTDILTFVTFDTGSAYLVAVKNLV